MSANYLGGDANALIGASACFQTQCMGDIERDALDVYLRVQALKGAGGTDYSSSLNALLQAAKVFQVLQGNKNTRDAVDLYVDLQNAIADGYSGVTDANGLSAAAKCYTCLPAEQLKILSLFLKIQLSILNKAE